MTRQAPWLLGSIIWLCLWCVPHTASAEPTPLEEELTEALTSGVEGMAPLHGFRTHGEALVQALIGIFERSTAPRHVRLRALGALGSLERRSAGVYLASLLDDRDAGRLQRIGALHPLRATSALRRTMQGLERHPGQLVPVERVLSLLGHREVTIRVHAVRLLALQATPEALGRLRQLEERELSPKVRAALSQVLKGRSALPAASRPAAPGSGWPPR